MVSNLQRQTDYTLLQLTNQVMGRKGAHILYMFNEQESYMENAIAYIVEGLDNGESIILAESRSNYRTIKQRLVAIGYTGASLERLIYIHRDSFYLSEKGFNADLSFSQFERIVLENTKNGINTRTWGNVIVDRSSISEIRKYESKCDAFIYGKEVISVCTYNALTTPSFFQNELLKIHEYVMIDDAIAKSPFYDKQYLPFSPIERERVDNLEKENNALKEKNEKLLIDKARQKEREKFLKTEKINAEKANHAKSIFLSQMSHDLRTPLNTIQGYTQILLLNDLSKKHLEKLTKMYHASEQLLQLIEEILDFTAIDTGRIPIQTEVIQLKPFIEECIGSILETQSSHVDVQLENVAEDVYIDADPLRLNQIITNLLDNAVKYSNPNGSVTICCDGENKETVNIQVKDNGPGIALKEKELIFEPFYRSENHVKGWKGTGLGLAIVAQLTTRMNGRYGVASSEGNGSTFWVCFNKINKVNYKRVDHSEDKWSPNNQSFYVLYMEDHPDNIAVMKAMLDFIGNIELCCVTSGEEGLEKITDQKPDFVLLDLNLPDLDGFEVLRRLKTQPSTKGIPVIAVSADAMEETIKQAYKEGAYAYITKPVDFKELRKLFTEAIETIK
ncbi:ATP-binding protein [Aquibacillus kalidii]|uniref:ATP-binding protein n=1 Tax=Aquibacillus kalidii TaxID=2762597 RepID=UPI001645205B|nr:ATP-binding protein [Aquibacillus kalidii]